MTAYYDDDVKRKKGEKEKDARLSEFPSRDYKNK